MRRAGQEIFDFGAPAPAAGGTSDSAIVTRITALAERYRTGLARKFQERDAEMANDDTSHHLVYGALGVSPEEGRLIDAYQNKGRFLYNHAGGLLEEAARLCFAHAFPSAERVMVPNTKSKRPKEFEIDCLIGNEAIEIKWRDATTDGDHIAKEEMRVAAIAEAGFEPVRVMFFTPNRTQAREIQKKIKAVYEQHHGAYHVGGNAFDYVQVKTGVDLKGLLTKIVG